MIDARGLLCPMPVVLVKKEVKNNPDTLEVLVDDRCALENITRFAGSCGYQVSYTQEGPDFRMVLKK